MRPFQERGVLEGQPTLPGGPDPVVDALPNRKSSHHGGEMGRNPGGGTARIRLLAGVCGRRDARGAGFHARRPRGLHRLRNRVVRALRRQRALPPVARTPALAAVAATARPQHDLPLHRREHDADRCPRADEPAPHRRARDGLAGRARWDRDERRCSCSRSAASSMWWAPRCTRRGGRTRGRAGSASTRSSTAW